MVTHGVSRKTRLYTLTFHLWTNIHAYIRSFIRVFSFGNHSSFTANAPCLHLEKRITQNATKKIGLSTGTRRKVVTFGGLGWKGASKRRKMDRWITGWLGTRNLLVYPLSFVYLGHWWWSRWCKGRNWCFLLLQGWIVSGSFVDCGGLGVFLLLCGCFDHGACGWDCYPQCLGLKGEGRGIRYGDGMADGRAQRRVQTKISKGPKCGRSSRKFMITFLIYLDVAFVNSVAR